MTIKKNILNDLKKYNHDLDDHLSDLDFSSINKMDLKNSSENEEYFSLIGTNLVDLRTELALLRKNLSVEIEGMVLKTISEQQNLFLKQANDFYSNMILDLKKNFSDYIGEINSQMQFLRKDLNKISVNNSSFESKLSMFGEDILGFKSVVNKFDLDNKKNESLLADLNSEITNLSNNVNDLKTYNIKNNNNFENHILSIEKNISSDHLNSVLSDFLGDIIKKLNNLDNKSNAIGEDFTVINDKLSILDKKSDLINNLSSEINSLKEKKISLNKSSVDVSGKVSDINSCLESLNKKLLIP